MNDEIAKAIELNSAAIARHSLLLERLLQRMAVDSAPVVVTKTRAARELELSPRTIHRMVRDGELSVVMVRGRPRIPFSEVLRVGAIGPKKPAPTRVEKFSARQEAQDGRAALRGIR